MDRLAGKVALITGAASGIGLACAEAMLSEGATVWLTDIDASICNHQADRLADGRHGRAHCLRLDVTEENEWVAAMDAVIAHDRRLDILVNNAGIGIGGDITALSLDDWRRQQAVNLDGMFLGIKHALPRMRAEKKGAKGGAIVNIASVTGIRGSGVFVSYAAAKGGVLALTRAVAKQCAAQKDGIRVNAICPGVIDTPIFKALEGVDGDAADPSATAATLVPLGHVGQPEDIAWGAVYLASDQARYVTGTQLVIDGGLLIG